MILSRLSKAGFRVESNPMYRRIVVCALLFTLLADTCRAADSAMIGVATESFKGYVGTAPLSPGSTIFRGDRLSTEADGRVWLRSKGTQVYLNGRTAVTVKGTAGAPSIDLQNGALSFSSATGAGMQVLALGSDLRPASDAPANADVCIAGPRSLRIFVRKGALRFSYGGESEVIPEGSRVAVLLDPSDPQEPKGAGSTGSRKHRRFLIALGLGGAAAVAAWIVTHKQQESPDHP